MRTGSSAMLEKLAAELMSSQFLGGQTNESE